MNDGTLVTSEGANSVWCGSTSSTPSPLSPTAVRWLPRDGCCGTSHDGLPRRAAGLGGVLVRPAHRGRGTARTVISVAVEHARAAGAETMILLCRPELVPFYTQLGWGRLPVPVTFQQPDGPRTSPLTTMIYDLAHPGIGVDLRGLPF